MKNKNPANSISEVWERLGEENCEIAEIILAAMHFSPINIQYLRTLRFLDLGCGSINTTDAHTTYGIFEPRLCRYLYEIGVDVIGVDLFAQGANEKFPSLQIDLSKKNALSFLLDQSFDIVVCSRFMDFGDPWGRWTSPKLKSSSLQSLHSVAATLLFEAKRLLREEGKMLGFWNNRPRVFVKEELFTLYEEKFATMCECGFFRITMISSRISSGSFFYSLNSSETEEFFNLIF